MRLKDYLADYAGPGPKALVRGVAEWLDEQARVTANALRIAAIELREQLSVWP